MHRKNTKRKKSEAILYTHKGTEIGVLQEVGGFSRELVSIQNGVIFKQKAHLQHWKILTDFIDYNTVLSWASGNHVQYHVQP